MLASANQQLTSGAPAILVRVVEVGARFTSRSLSGLPARNENPAIGERKRGDLADLFVYKFRSQNQLYLLGYTVDAEVRLVYLEAVGPHENFYRDLKRS